MVQSLLHNREDKVFIEKSGKRKAFHTGSNSSGTPLGDSPKDLAGDACKDGVAGKA